MCGFIAQLIEQRTGNAEVTGSNPVETLIFFQASSFQLLKLENVLRWSFSVSQRLSPYKVQQSVAEQPLEMEVDTGTSLSVMSEELYNYLFSAGQAPQLVE